MGLSKIRWKASRRDWIAALRLTYDPGGWLGCGGAKFAEVSSLYESLYLKLTIALPSKQRDKVDGRIGREEKECRGCESGRRERGTKG